MLPKSGTRIVHQRPRREPARRLAANTVSMFAYDRKSSVPMTATRIRKTPRTRVRASPRPASTIPRQSRAISHPLPGCTETPKDDIAIVQALVIGGDVPVDPPPGMNRPGPGPEDRGAPPRLVAAAPPTDHGRTPPASKTRLARRGRPRRARPR